MNALRTMLLLAAGLSAAESCAVEVSKSLPQFWNMIKHVMPDSWPVFHYADYGCYCGKGGSGTPVDDLDRCCMVHDRCYGDAMQQDVHSPYTESYNYTLGENKTITCGSSNSTCVMFICECDRKAAECFARSNYNAENKHLSSDLCQ